MKPLGTILDGLTEMIALHGDATGRVGAIRYDSRRVEPGDLYVAINGRDDHGLEHLDDAIARGAGVVVIDEPGRIPAEKASVTFLHVRNARRAMAEAASIFYDHPARGMRIYGVTGTNGKTTVTHVLHALLGSADRKVGAIGTLGATIETTRATGYTTPEAPELMEIFVDMRAAGVEDVVMEVSSHALALHRVDMLRFAGALFTNITQDHLDFHLTFKDYFNVKKSLFDRLDADATAVVNFDDVQGAELVGDTHAAVLRYGHGEEADLRIDDAHVAADGSAWIIRYGQGLGGGEDRFHSTLTGAFNVANITAACGMALAAGVEREALPRLVAALTPVPGRMESITLPNGATAIVDYAHTPDALENLLTTVRAIVGRGRLRLVVGCGGDRDRGKRPLMGSIAARLADEVIVTSDNPRSEDPEAIIDAVIRGVESVTEGRAAVDVVIDRREAIVCALSRAEPNDAVVIAGKGHESVQIIGEEHHPFDDREVVRRWSNDATVAEGR